MTIEIKAPALPESVPDGTIATWYKKPGESVSRDELLVDIETDKVVIEVVSPNDGVLKEVLKDSGDTIVSNEAIGVIEAGASAPAPAPAAEATTAAAPAASAAESAPPSTSEEAALLSPAARKLAEENNVDIDSVHGSGKDGRITKEDIIKHLETPSASAAPAATAELNLTASTSGRIEERVPMSRLRAKVA